MKKAIQQSLKKQIILVLFVPMFLIIMFVVSRYYYVLNNELHKSIELQAAQIIDRTAIAVQDDIRYSKYFELSSTILNLYNSSIKYEGKEVFKILEVALLDLDNKILAHSHPLNNPLLSNYSNNQKTTLNYKNNIGDIEFSWIEKDKHLLLKKKVWFANEPIGYLYIDIKPQSLIEAQKQIFTEVTLLIIFIISGLSFFLLVFGQWIETPVRVINNELKKLGSGDVSFNSLKDRKDEFKQIIRSIDQADKRIYLQQQELLIGKEFTERILNAQTNFTLVTDGKDLQKANNSMLEFFGYESLEDFHKEHDCICDFFINENGYLSKEVNGKTWLEEIREHSDKIHYVKINNLEGSPRVFQIVTVDEEIKETDENIIVITFTDITEEKDFQQQLQEKVDAQLEQIRKNDLLIIEQSKMAALGEMIANIAHQWRQPLSLISTVSTGSIFQHESGLLTDKLLKSNMETINENAQYLSKTIDDFRDFIKGDQKKVTFNLTDEVESFLHLVEGSIKSNDIQIIKDIEDNIIIDGYPNMLVQCFINIFNNAKDVLKEVDEDRFVFISVVLEENQVSISFKDNAGGIPKDILPKIFEPYFTTKHQSQGTGLGLHMTYNLITDAMKGSIKASNTTYIYEDVSYTGAEFIITLPIIKDE